MRAMRHVDGDGALSIEEREGLEAESREEFDRVGFAMTVLEALKPRRMTIAVCTGRSRIRVESGRVWGGAEGARWAWVSVPPRASRGAILLALADLAGEAASRPYVLDVLHAKAHAGLEP